MPVTVVLGMQWGDEGKGKVIDYLVSRDGFHIIERYQGGPNAGHTIVVDGEKIITHHIPSCINDALLISGPGTVIDPVTLEMEIDYIEDNGVDVRGRYIIDPRATLILPVHRLEDVLREYARGKDRAIGTTGRGIGPAYADRYSRDDIRAGHLFYPDHLQEKIEKKVERINDLIKDAGIKKSEVRKILKNITRADRKAYGDMFPEDVDYEMLLDESGRISYKSLLHMIDEKAGSIKSNIKDSLPVIHKYLEDGKSVLAEGAQGTALDLTFGTHPYVTSSHPTIGGFLIGTGVSYKDIKDVIGVAKAYVTRVGSGPFPTEIRDEEMAEELREKGGEYGATTGRARRIGWPDFVLLDYSAKVNGINKIVLTKADVLSGMNEIPICMWYEVDGSRTNDFPWNASFEDVKPVYGKIPGWDIENDDYESLKLYANMIQYRTKAKVITISTGADRNDMMELDI